MAAKGNAALRLSAGAVASTLLLVAGGCLPTPRPWTVSDAPAAEVSPEEGHEGRAGEATAAASPAPRSPIETLSTLFGSVVRVRALSATRIEPNSGGALVRDYEYGSGVLLDPSGLIVTAAHVIRDRHRFPPDEQEVEVLARGTRQYVPAEVVVEEPGDDLALLRVNPRVVQGLEALRPVAPETGRSTGPAYVLGIRAGAPPEEFEIGIIAGSFRDVDARLAELGGLASVDGRYLGLSQEIFPGYSGGPILDERGALVGVVLGAPNLEGRWVEFSYGMGGAAIVRLQRMVEP